MNDTGDISLPKLSGNPALAGRVEAHVIHARIAMAVYEIRVRAGMSQKRLAELVGTQQSVISRIEDSDYDGHSLSLLRKIAKVLGKGLEIRFTDDPLVRPVTSSVFTPEWESNSTWNVRIRTSKPKRIRS